MERLSRAAIVRALELLASELPAAERPAELFVVGGAALVLLYGAREATKDVDAFLGAKGYVHGWAPGVVVLTTPSIVVHVLAPQQLLAMKLSAWRDDIDVEDARLLLSNPRGDREAVWKLVEPHVLPGRELTARYAFDDLWETRDAV